MWQSILIPNGDEISIFEQIFTFKKNTKKCAVKRQAHLRYIKKKNCNSLNFILPSDDKGTTRLSLPPTGLL